jgi:hypothetical protein
MSRREILKVFPTKERLVKFILAFYGLFSRKLGVTNFNYDDIIINKEPYWGFWLRYSKSMGLPTYDYEFYFFLMNCIWKNISLLNSQQLTEENIEVPTYNEYEVEVNVVEDSSEYGDYDVYYEGYATKEQLYRSDNWDHLIPEWSNPYDHDMDYRDSEVYDSDLDITETNLIRTTNIYE